jgi:predicted RNase H-like HicB family nuclease
VNEPHYHINLFWSAEDKYWIADVPDLRPCSAHGDARAEALANVKDAIEGWLEVALERGCQFRRLAIGRQSTRQDNDFIWRAFRRIALAAFPSATKARSMLRSVRKAGLPAIVLLSTVLVSCHRAEQEPVQAQRIALDKVPAQGEQPLASPDTKGASWVLAANGEALDFGKPGARPFVTLACNPAPAPARITVIRHAPARPGEKALFPVIGNGKISRFMVDAAHAGDEWRWQGTLPADDPLLEVFAGSRALEATLPGGGTVKIEGSAAPGEFVAQCRDKASAPG